MTIDEAKKKVMYKLSFGEAGGVSYITDDSVISILEEVFNDFEKEFYKVKKDRDYWKLSFNRQVEASRV